MYTNFEISKSGNEHWVLGPVLVPNVIDRQGDACSAEEVAKACANYNAGPKWVYKNHEEPLSDCEVLESYITPGPMEVGGVKVPTGSWVVKFKVSEEIYKAAKRGELQGFSIGGRSGIEEQL